MLNSRLDRNLISGLPGASRSSHLTLDSTLTAGLACFLIGADR